MTIIDLPRMKQNPIFLAAALLMLPFVSGCLSDPQTGSGSAAIRTVRFTARQPETRSTFDDAIDGLYPTRWTERDTAVAVALNYGPASAAKAVPSPDGRKAEIEYSFIETASEYCFHALTPASAAQTLSASRKGWLVRIPAVQTPLPNSPDEAAQILAATSETSATVPEELNLDFYHVTSYGRLTLEGLSDKIKVRSVTLSCRVPLSGTWDYFLDGSSAGTLEPREASSSITLMTSAKENIWFACAPGDVSGAEMRVSVKTSLGLYEKTIQFHEDRSFKPGKVASFSVDFSGIKPGKEQQGIDSLLESERYGAYLAEGNHLWQPGFQLSREYDARGRVTFAILDPEGYTTFEFGGIPVNPIVGDRFTLSFSILQGPSVSRNTYAVTVLKADAAKLWLSDIQGNGFIVKK